MSSAASGDRARALTPALWAGLAGLAAMAILLLGACASVEPWERGRLSHPAMEEGREPEADNMAQHEAGAREGALGPGASGGGGCGCN